jgi:hypothetical protein
VAVLDFAGFRRCVTPSSKIFSMMYATGRSCANARRWSFFLVSESMYAPINFRPFRSLITMLTIQGVTHLSTVFIKIIQIIFRAAERFENIDYLTAFGWWCITPDMPNVRKKGKKFVSAWIPTALYTSLRAVADQQNRPASDVINELLTQYTESQPLTLRDSPASSAKVAAAKAVAVKYSLKRASSVPKKS